MTDERYVKPEGSTFLKPEKANLELALQRARETGYGTVIKTLFAPFEEGITITDYEQYVSRITPTDELLDSVNREFISETIKKMKETLVSQLSEADEVERRLWKQNNLSSPEELGELNKTNVYDYFLLVSFDWSGDDPDWVFAEGVADFYISLLGLNEMINLRLEEIINPNPLTEGADRKLWNSAPNTAENSRDHETLRRLFSEEFEKL